MPGEHESEDKNGLLDDKRKFEGCIGGDRDSCAGIGIGGSWSNTNR